MIRCAFPDGSFNDVTLHPSVDITNLNTDTPWQYAIDVPAVRSEVRSHTSDCDIDLTKVELTCTGCHVTHPYGSGTLQSAFTDASQLSE